MRYSFVLISLLCLSACGENFPQYVSYRPECIIDVSETLATDVDSSIGSGRESRSSYYRSDYIGDTCFIAGIGHRAFSDQDNEDPDLYWIDVTIQTSPTRYRVLFRREFESSALRSDFSGVSIEDVFEYVEADRTVSFSFDGSTYRYVLPEPELSATP